MAEGRSPALQLEAATLLTNITAGSSQQTTAVVESGAVPHFIRLLQSKEEKLAEKSILRPLEIFVAMDPGPRDIVTMELCLPSLPRQT